MNKFLIMFVMLLGSVATIQAQTFDFSCDDVQSNDGGINENTWTVLSEDFTAPQMESLISAGYVGALDDNGNQRLAQAFTAVDRTITYPDGTTFTFPSNPTVSVQTGAFYDGRDDSAAPLGPFTYRININGGTYNDLVFSDDADEILTFLLDYNDVNGIQPDPSAWAQIHIPRGFSRTQVADLFALDFQTQENFNYFIHPTRIGDASIVVEKVNGSFEVYDEHGGDDFSALQNASFEEAVDYVNSLLGNSISIDEYIGMYPYDYNVIDFPSFALEHVSNSFIESIPGDTFEGQLTADFNHVMGRETPNDLEFYTYSHVENVNGEYLIQNPVLIENGLLNVTFPEVEANGIGIKTVKVAVSSVLSGNVGEFVVTKSFRFVSRPLADIRGIRLSEDGIDFATSYENPYEAPLGTTLSFDISAWTELEGAILPSDVVFSLPATDHPRHNEDVSIDGNILTVVFNDSSPFIARVYASSEITGQSGTDVFLTEYFQASLDHLSREEQDIHYWNEDNPDHQTGNYDGSTLDYNIIDSVSGLNVNYTIEYRGRNWEAQDGDDVYNTLVSGSLSNVIFAIIDRHSN